ncbi:hypothetical protein MANI_116058 [Metarhizium anisopliae]|nr:hypothetical protein MANI_116058 [Metarhizium anisopliae]
MTHASILDCLSVDTFVGGLYNFFSGVNGSRAIRMLQNFCNRVLEEPFEGLDEPHAEIETPAIALSTALRELLKREQRARLNDDLPALVDSVENLSKSLAEGGLRKASALLMHQMGEVRAVVDRARGLIDQEDADIPDFADAPAPVYPHGLHMPKDRHDNDKIDITAMKIFPTRGEILSEAADFLPSTDLEQPHFLTNKSQRHIDTQFRLLRHDTFGELKDVIAGLLRASEMDPAYLDNPRLNFGNFRANRYSNAMFSYVFFGSRSGLEANISFSQPPNVRDKSPPERRRWWEDSRRLSEGVLVSFIAIHEDQVQHLFLIISDRRTDEGKDESLAKDARRATITARLTNHDQVDIATVVGLSRSKARGVLVEFPGVLPATFVPILENLQSLQRLGSLPFQNWILPDKTEHVHETAMADIPPPRYACNPGFAFSLKPILKKVGVGDTNLSIEPNSISDNEDLINKVEAETDLDRGQCRALIAALSREFALIQGPPGTGKSYLGIKLMKVLLNCQTEADLGPIVVVCYTNHALDQFLEHVLHDGTKKIIRIGGQSHSNLLEGHNLRTVSQMESKSRSERYLLAKSYEDLDDKTEDIKRVLGRAHGTLRQMKWDNIQRYLSRYYPRICKQFRPIDKDGFQTVGRHPFDIWASYETTAADARENYGTETEIDHDTILRKADLDVHSLSPRERQYLKNFWSTENHKQAVDDLFEDIKHTSSTQREVSKIHDEVDRRVLQEADVIGITTTGLAKRYGR